MSNLIQSLHAGSIATAAALAALEDEDGEVDDAAWAAYTAAAADLTADLSAAVAARDAVGRTADVIKAHAAALTVRARRLSEYADRLHTAITHAVLDAGGKAIAGPYQLSVSPGRPIAVVDPYAPLESWPEDLVRVTRAPAKVELLRALTAGDVVEGASIGTGAPTLRVRPGGA